MKFEKFHCPECGGPAIGTADHIPGVALFLPPGAGGSVEYEGETKIYWDGQTTETDKNGNPILICAEGHEWGSRCEEG